MSTERIDIEVEGPTPVVDEFVALDDELYELHRKDFVSAKEIDTQCSAWDTDATAELRKRVRRCDSTWTLEQQLSIIYGTYAAGGPRKLFEPCVRVTGTISDGSKTIQVSTFYTKIGNFHLGFPQPVYYGEESPYLWQIGSDLTSLVGIIEAFQSKIRRGQRFVIRLPWGEHDFLQHHLREHPSFRDLGFDVRYAGHYGAQTDGVPVTLYVQVPKGPH